MKIIEAKDWKIVLRCEQCNRLLEITPKDLKIESIFWGLKPGAIALCDSSPVVVFECAGCAAKNEIPAENIPEDILSELKTKYYDSGGKLLE
jgi:hypothetical protein